MFILFLTACMYMLVCGYAHGCAEALALPGVGDAGGFQAPVRFSTLLKAGPFLLLQK